MIGPRDRRPPYAGHWYRYSSNGWGIVDFMDFCEAAGFEYIPDFNINETPEDMADFIEYAKGPPTANGAASGSPTGIRSPTGSPTSNSATRNAWMTTTLPNSRRSPRPSGQRIRDVILVVGDFAYDADQRSDQNHRCRVAVSPIWPDSGRSCAGPRAQPRGLVRRPRLDGRPGASTPRRDALRTSMRSAKVAAGARHKVVVFEYNSSNHAQ